MYHMTDLGTLVDGNQENSIPTAINNLGQVVGYADTGTSPRAFLHSNGVMTNLGSPNDRPTYAYGINDGGTIVGKFLTPGGGSHPFAYSGGTYTDLWAPDAGGQGAAYAINNAGQIVGNDIFEYPQITPKTDFAALQYPLATAVICDFNRFDQFSIHPMKSFPANDYGLYAMSGCVWEWTADWYDAEFYNQSASFNPQGPTKGKKRVARGGSWADCAEAVTVSFRMAMGGEGAPSAGNPNIGFRLCRVEA